MKPSLEQLWRNPNPEPFQVMHFPFYDDEGLPPFPARLPERAALNIERAIQTKPWLNLGSGQF